MPSCIKALKPYFKGPIVTNDGYSLETGLKAIEEGLAEAVSFGYLAINNPDLVERAKNNYPLNTSYDYSTLYVGGPKGYTDWPNYKA